MIEHEHIDGSLKLIIDGMSLWVVIATLAEKLPSIAAGLSILWTLLRMTEWCIIRWRRWRRNP